MKTLPEMKKLTIEVADGIVTITQHDSYRTQTITIPENFWFFFADEVRIEIDTNGAEAVEDQEVAE